MKNLKAIVLYAALLFATIGLSAQAPDWVWARQAGGNGYDQGMAIALDNQANQYVSGYFTGTADFGTTSLTSSGDYDVFTAKLDPAGNILWAVRAGGELSDQAFAIAVDASANVYVSGYFRGTAQFGTVTLSDNGMYQAFVSKLDTNGNFLWTVQGGGTSDDIGYDLVVDPDSNVFVTGYFQGSANFGPITLVSNGSKDVFAAKLDAAGNWLWATGAGGIYSDFGNGISLDSSGNCYITGSFHLAASIGAFNLTSSGGDDIFVAKLDNTGNILWAVKAGGISTDWGLDLALDNAGNAYITGIFNDAATFGSCSLTSAGLGDIFAAKLDPSGNFLWAVRAGGTDNDFGYSIAVDVSSNVYVTGYFSGTVAFGSTNLSSIDDVPDIFVAGLDSNGNFLSAVQAGGSGPDRGQGIATDSSGNIFVTGYFWYTSQFGPASISSQQNQDIFVAKLASGMSIDDDHAGDVSALSCLYSAFPNPFHRGDTAHIKARIAESETGTLTLYNLRGQIISSQELRSGNHELNLNSNKLPTGLYLYNLRTRSVNVTGKLVLLN